MNVFRLIDQTKRVGRSLVLKRAVHIAFLTFTISLLISSLFQFVFALWISLILLILVVLIGIAFDIVGTAVTAAVEAPFHAMGANKIKGSKQSIFLIRHADQVANFCNDVVGDICGTIGGAIIAGISVQIISKYAFLPEKLTGAAAIGFVAALTVGGKALGKAYAIERANQIVFSVGKLLYFFKILNLDIKKRKRRHYKKGSIRRKGRKN